MFIYIGVNPRLMSLKLYFSVLKPSATGDHGASYTQDARGEAACARSPRGGCLEAVHASAACARSPRGGCVEAVHASAHGDSPTCGGHREDGANPETRTAPTRSKPW